MLKETVGIASIGYYIPSGILTSKEMAKLANNIIKPGNIVVLASSAASFSWAALTVKYD